MAITANKTNKHQVVQYSPEDMDFISQIENRITLYGQLPYTIPQKLIVEVIKQSAKWFYVHSASTWKQSYFHISKSDIIADNKMNGFSTCLINLPPRIRIVQEIYDSSESKDMDLSSAMYLSASVGGAQGLYQSNIDNHLYILEGATKMVESRALKYSFSSKMPFEYVTQTSELILKRIPENNILLDVKCDIPLQKLYDYTFFYDHVLSKCRSELKRLIGGHTFPLPGDVTVNGDEICEGHDLWKEIETSVKASNGLGDIIMKR